ncbi:MAG: hypothetical protein JWQ88_1281 [Rhodoferax sp.]|nr:hypothetical protein [Rhodoferax sp.]
MRDVSMALGLPLPRMLFAMAWLYGLLALASLGSALATATGSPLRAQINAWWLIFPLVSLSLVMVPHGPLLLLLLIAWLAWRELVNLCTAEDRRRFSLGCVVVTALQAWLTWRAPAWATAMMAMLLAVLAVMFVMAVRLRARPASERMGPLLFALLGLGLSFVPLLLMWPQTSESGAVDPRWYFYLMVVTALNDIGQFISGKRFGRHRIAARISPQKTWQGLAGGMVVSVVVSLSLGLYLQLAGAALLVVLGLLLSVAGFAGDLTFSAAKRRLGIKDFSNLIPGHGGILDRVDSLVLTAPMLYLALAVSTFTL